MADSFDLRAHGITVTETHCNLAVGALYEHALRYEKKASIGIGKRIPLAHTRAILDSIHSGALTGAAVWRDPIFGVDVVTECPRVPSEILQPRETWADKSGYDASANKLAELFIKNFKKYEEGTDPEIKASSPVPLHL